MLRMHTVEMTAAEEGQRLDRYLRKLLPETPLSGIFKMLRRGIIRVDGKKAKEDLRLIAGMQVTLPPSAMPRTSMSDLAHKTAGKQSSHAAPRHLPSPNLQPEIVHQDDHLLIIDKPAGLPAQPGTGHEHHVLSWLDSQPFGVRTATYRPAPVHRLDRGTSGLLVIGLSPQASRNLADSFRQDKVRKCYVAVVEGIPKSPKGQIEAALLVRETARAHQPKVLCDDRGKDARTDFEVLNSGRQRALLGLQLHTGRMHQIRAHLGHISHPIVGDHRYGAKGQHRSGVFFLHASELTLPHPITCKSMTFRAPIPARFHAALNLR